jgi:short-subunit dehydrogenase
MATLSQRPLAVVTGASSGIGAELALCAANAGFDLIIAADEPEIESAAARLGKEGATVQAVQADLSQTQGVDKLLEATRGRPIDALLANAGRGMGHAFLDQSFDDVKLVIDTNVTGTLYLLHKVGSQMRARGKGRILITGSIAGFMPGTFQAVYNGTKAFLDSFASALRAELKDSGVTVTCLMPGATETEFFARADMLDTKVGSGKKQPAEEVARAGFEAMMKGQSEIVTGWQNKLRVAFSHVAPSELLAEVHRMMAKPQGATKS